MVLQTGWAEDWKQDKVCRVPGQLWFQVRRLAGLGWVRVQQAVEGVQVHLVERWERLHSVERWERVHSVVGLEEFQVRWVAG